jgi:hypothetical protein
MVVDLHTVVIYHGTTAIYCGILTVENIGTVVKYHGIILNYGTMGQCYENTTVNYGSNINPTFSMVKIL